MTASNDHASSDVSKDHAGNSLSPSMHHFFRIFSITPSKLFFAPPDHSTAERSAPIRQTVSALARINSFGEARYVHGDPFRPGASINTSSISIVCALNKQGNDALSENPFPDGLQSLETAMTECMRY
jgi:hypothetical protein